MLLYNANSPTKIEDIHSQKTNIAWILMIRHFDFPNVVVEFSVECCTVLYFRFSTGWNLVQSLPIGVTSLHVHVLSGNETYVHYDVLKLLWVSEWPKKNQIESICGPLFCLEIQREDIGRDCMSVQSDVF